MRIYQSASIKDEPITGFQSPCSEFAEKPLSLDERYAIGNPSLKLLTAAVDAPHFGIMKNDQLLIDLSMKPGPKSLLVTFVGDELKLFRGNNFKEMDDTVFGVVILQLRSF